MWSGGKDSALALMRARGAGLVVTRLLNFHDRQTGRVRFHATPAKLIASQADAMGIELEQVGTSWDGFDVELRRALERLRVAGFTGVILGDIHLADVRRWYMERIVAGGLAHIEPLWGESSAGLLAEFVASGSRAVVTCCEDGRLDESWLGRIIDERFAVEIASLPIDAAGENGEYHSFVFESPLFRAPVGWAPGGRGRDGAFSQLLLESPHR